MWMMSWPLLSMFLGTVLTRPRSALVVVVGPIPEVSPISLGRLPVSRIEIPFERTYHLQYHLHCHPSQFRVTQKVKNPNNGVAVPWE